MWQGGTTYQINAYKNKTESKSNHHSALDDKLMSLYIFDFEKFKSLLE